jgi:hypothetical protein
MDIKIIKDDINYDIRDNVYIKLIKQIITYNNMNYYYLVVNNLTNKTNYIFNVGIDHKNIIIANLYEN